MSVTSPMLAIESLAVTFGEFALRDIDFSVPRGGRLAILGRSGSGKTLLLETLMGARRPTAGRVLLDGRDITRTAPEARGIAYIPQDLALFPHLSVIDNIRFGLNLRRGGAAEAMPVDEAVALLGLEPVIRRRDIRSLSGGERQRVALARALLVRPKAIFLDEPFSALDTSTRTELVRSFRAMAHTLGMTVVLVTHDLDEAFLLADRVAILDGGRLVREGRAADVRRDPQTVAVARFLNFRSIVPATMLTRPAADGVTHYAIPHESITLVDAGHADLHGRIVECLDTPHGRIAVVDLDHTSRLEVSIGAVSLATPGTPATGATVGIQLDDSALVPLRG